LLDTVALHWFDRVLNDEVLQRTGQVSLSHLLSRRRISLFGHVAQLGDDTPVNMALRLPVNTSLSGPPDCTWRRPPGRPWTGLTSLETTPAILLETSGGTLLAADMVVRRRDGPSRLSDHDDGDDEDFSCLPMHIETIT